MKRTTWRRLGRKLAILTAGGVLLTGAELSCAGLSASSALSSTNFCFLLNCNDGALGGLIDFCAPVSYRSFLGGDQGSAQAPLLADCPQSL